jgi:hypothetical protein
MSVVGSAGSVQEFFLAQVREVMSDLQVETAEATERYLVDLLCGFSVSERIPTLFEPLVMLLQRAQQASGPERTQRMRDLGDMALFVNGFFPDSFERRGLTQTYVVTMGGRAYLVVDEAVRGQGARDVPVFAELAARFQDFSHVLDEVRERTALCTDATIVRMYERFRESGSPTLLRRLQRRGLQPDRPRRAVH